DKISRTSHTLIVFDLLYMFLVVKTAGAQRGRSWVGAGNGGPHVTGGLAADYSQDAGQPKPTLGQLGCQADPANEHAWADVPDFWSFKLGTPPYPTTVCPGH
ncbi:hypothetical protein MJO28_001345, partial [Puccinia striiformis f. sp. tritici]